MPSVDQQPQRMGRLPPGPQRVPENGRVAERRVGPQRLGRRHQDESVAAGEPRKGGLVEPAHDGKRHRPDLRLEHPESPSRSHRACPRGRRSAGSAPVPQGRSCRRQSSRRHATRRLPIAAPADGRLAPRHRLGRRASRQALRSTRPARTVRVAAVRRTSLPASGRTHRRAGAARPGRRNAGTPRVSHRACCPRTRRQRRPERSPAPGNPAGRGSCVPAKPRVRRAASISSLYSFVCSRPLAISSAPASANRPLAARSSRTVMRFRASSTPVYFSISARFG